jgi:hypothetical protein
MKIYTFYSDSHKYLYDIFIESLRDSNPEIDVVTDILDQEGSGSFMENGWESTMDKKLDQIIRACEIGETFIHSDSDVIFLKDIKEEILLELGDSDIAFQDDGEVGLCMGFFICKPNPKIISLFKKVKEILPEFQGHDQNAINSIIKNYGVNYKKLSHRFFNYGQTRHKIWNGEDFEVPKNVLVFHANWTIGIENKLKLISLVKQQINNR